LAAIVSLAVALPIVDASNAAAEPPRLSDRLESLWTTVFDLPVGENPFTGGDPCLAFEDPLTGKPILAPFAPSSPDTTCTVEMGTKLFVTGWSSECSDLEDPPFHGDGDSGLRACARAADAGLNTPLVTFDDRPVHMHEVETALMQAALPANNIFGQPAGTPIESVGHGWVALLPLTPGEHEVVIHVTGTYVSPPGPLDVTTTTTIIVTR
jgi:hypothetical protein